MAIPKMNATVHKRIDLNPRLMVLQVAPEGWKIPDFKAGQYCAMGLSPDVPRHPESGDETKPSAPDKLINRTYSLASSPHEKSYLEIYLTMVKGGTLTPRLFSLHEGDKLWVSPRIVGNFTTEALPENAHAVLISTGTGLGPYMSMIRAGMHKNRPGTAVLHGVRQSWDLGYQEELRALEKENPGFLYLPTISRPQNEKKPWEGRTGYVQDIWKERILDKKWNTKLTAENTHFFLCGSPAMVDTMFEILQKEGYQEHTSRTPGQIHVERYW